MFGVSDKFIQCCVREFERDIQADILQEECAELIKALSKVKRGTKSLNDVKEEMSHVLISSAVVATIFGISEQDVCAEVAKKAEKYKFNLEGENK